MKDRNVSQELSAKLAMIYYYGETGNLILSKDAIDEYDRLLNENLKEMGSNAMWIRNQSELPYFYTKDENGKMYCVWNSQCNYEELAYEICYLSDDIVVASRKDNTLNAIAIKTVNNKLQRKDKVLIKK